MENKKKLRDFGLLFFLVFFILGLYPKVINNEDINIYLVVVSLVFLFLGLIKSKSLIPLLNLWLKFGLLLSKIISPVIIFLLYLLVVVPIGICMQLLKKDYLNLKINKNLDSYWEHRDEFKSSMRNQF